LLFHLSSTYQQSKEASDGCGLLLVRCPSRDNVCGSALYPRKTTACWLLVVFPSALCVGLFLDLAHGAQRLGQASYSSDLRTLPYVLGFLVVALIAALRPRWAWLFWIGWVFSALICAVVVFLTYFWKVFS